MEGALDPVSPADLARLHRVSIQGPIEVASFLRRVMQGGGAVSNGINRRNTSRVAKIDDVGPAEFALRFENQNEKPLPQLFLTCDLDDRRYFFAATVVRHDARGLVHALVPEVVYQAERRDLERGTDRIAQRDGPGVEIRSSRGKVFSGEIVDSSYHGLGVAVAASPDDAFDGELTLRFLSGVRAGELTHGVVRHRSRIENREGWIKIGLAVSSVPVGEPVMFEKRDRILALGGVSRISRRATLIRGLAKAATLRAVRRVGIRVSEAEGPRIIQYESAPGEAMRAIVDSWGDTRGATAVVIPPAWGRTKETLSPLAATIVQTFRESGQPISVIRFDGTHRRGESYIPPDLRQPGAEYLRFTFSRAVRDIHATFECLRDSSEFQPSKIILSTFSLASIEGRRAVATDPTGLVAGWISVVGMVDLQSALKTISGGIDYGFGLTRGVRFGHHELVGVVADMDHTGLDAIRHRLGFLEDARRDMAQINVPVTWIHGREDAWMDVERVRHLMSCGKTENRRVIEVPTGHQLRTSAEAFGVFGLVASEVSRIACGRAVEPAIPDISELDRRNQAERRRLPKAPIRLREFWNRYLLGRDARFGFQLLTATSAYRAFMHEQIDALALSHGMRVLDLGSGMGDFAVQLATDYEVADVVIDAADFIKEALHRTVARMSALRNSHSIRVNPILLDIDLGDHAALPFVAQRYDAVLASLAISYVFDPLKLLAKIRSVIRPGGKLVISTLKRDADISGLHVEGLAELRAGRAKEVLGAEAAESIDELARGFLNDASRILDLEEEGTFRFFDLDELADLARKAGFTVDRAFYSLGDPAQAAILVAHRN